MYEEVNPKWSKVGTWYTTFHFNWGHHNKYSNGMDLIPWLEIFEMYLTVRKLMLWSKVGAGAEIAT